MAPLSEKELEIIAAYPIKDEFKELIAIFKGKNRDLLAGDENLFTDPDERSLALRFIRTLLSLPAAEALPSKYESEALSSDIIRYYSAFSANISLIAKPIRAVVRGEKDQEIWAKLLEVIARTRSSQPPHPKTPPRSYLPVPSSFQQTPYSFNSGSITDASELRSQVDSTLKHELRPSLRLDIRYFMDAVFGHIPRLDSLVRQVFIQCQKAEYSEDSGWIGWPRIAVQETVLEWLKRIIERFTAWAGSVDSTPSRQIYIGPDTYLAGSPNKRKMDVGIMACTDKPRPDWAQILVTGELKRNPIEDGQETTWLDLATYAREVFRTQE